MLITSPYRAWLPCLSSYNGYNHILIECPYNTSLWSSLASSKLSLEPFLEIWLKLSLQSLLEHRALIGSKKNIMIMSSSLKIICLSFYFYIHFIQGTKPNVGEICKAADQILYVQILEGRQTRQNHQQAEDDPNPKDFSALTTYNLS